MPLTILITGFGPFPGAPYNPTEPLVRALAGRRHPGEVRRVVHIFDVSYEAVDRELPALIAREQPDALVMFGLAMRTRHVRIETRARNALARTLPDVGGWRPTSAVIAPGAAVLLPLPAPVQRLLLAARATGVPAALSHNAGRYLCNYLCWRTAEAATEGGPHLAAFVHVPIVPRWRPLPARRRRAEVTLDDLIAAGEAIVRAAALAARNQNPRRRGALISRRRAG